MIFRRTLATLLVNVIYNGRTVSRGMARTRSNVVRTAAKFYLLQAAVSAVTSSFRELAKVSGEVDRGFSKIRRISDLLNVPDIKPDFFETLEDVPTENIAEFQKTMEQVGRAGIQTKEEIEEVAVVISKFSRVIGESSDQATLTLTQLANLFNIPYNEQNFEDLSNLIIALGKSYPIKESELVNIMQRLGPVAEAFGLSIAEMAALGATVKSLGVRTEIAGSSMIRLLNSIGGHQKEIVEGFKLSSRESEKFFETFETDPFEGVLTFLEKLSELSFVEQNELLKEMGISGFRVIPAVRALTRNVGDLRKSIDIATDAIKENAELGKAYTIFAKDLQTSLTKLGVAWTKLKLELAETVGIDILIKKLTLFAEAANQLTSAFEKLTRFGIIGFSRFIERQLYDLDSGFVGKAIRFREAIEQDAKEHPIKFFYEFGVKNEGLGTKTAKNLFEKYTGFRDSPSSIITAPRWEIPFIIKRMTDDANKIRGKEKEKERESPLLKKHGIEIAPGTYQVEGIRNALRELRGIQSPSVMSITEAWRERQGSNVIRLQERQVEFLQQLVSGQQDQIEISQQQLQEMGSEIPIIGR